MTIGGGCGVWGCSGIKWGTRGSKWYQTGGARGVVNHFCSVKCTLKPVSKFRYFELKQLRVADEWKLLKYFW